MSENLQMVLLYGAPAVGIFTLLFAWMQILKVKREQPGNARMQEIAGAIHSGGPWPFYVVNIRLCLPL